MVTVLSSFIWRKMSTWWWMEMEVIPKVFFMGRSKVPDRFWTWDINSSVLVVGNPRSTETTRNYLSHCSRKRIRTADLHNTCWPAQHSYCTDVFRVSKREGISSALSTVEGKAFRTFSHKHEKNIIKMTCYSEMDTESKTKYKLQANIVSLQVVKAHTEVQAYMGIRRKR